MMIKLIISQGIKYKKIPYLSQETIREKINFINIFIIKYKLKDLLDVLSISKSNYFKYYKQLDKDYDEYLLIKEIFDESKGTYEYRRIEKGLLQKCGLIMNHKKIQRIMKKYNLRPQYTRILKNKKYKRIEEIVIDTLNEAIQKRKNVQGVILHSDQGFKYTSFQ